MADLLVLPQNTSSRLLRAIAHRRLQVALTATRSSSACTSFTSLSGTSGAPASTRTSWLAVCATLRTTGWFYFDGCAFTFLLGCGFQWMKVVLCNLDLYVLSYMFGP